MGPVSDTQQEYITDIFSSGQHLLSLINDILDLSKVEAGMMTVDLEAVEIKGLLSNSLSIVREKAGARSIRLELEMDDGLDICHLDVRKTKQIIYNLLSNAVKFSAQAGSVKLKARIVPRAAVGTMTGSWPVHGFPLSDNEYDAFLEIRVEDQGIGITQENMARLFQAFSQVDSGLARKFEGTGLGLAMVRQLTELLGGTVAVASAEGEGACFGAWLPLHAPVRSAIPPPHRALAAVTGSVASDIAQPTALVVEDDDQSADLVRLLLEAEGFAVLRASSGEAALLMAPQQPLSLITLDIQLPGIDGWEFLMRIGEIGALAQVPVVIISGLADGNLALTKGAAAVLQKPISRVQLKASLSNLGLHPAKERIHTVLVVDDDPKAVELITKFLPAPDYAVVRAYSGSEAITLAHTLKPDLILLDLMMPEMSGFEVVKVLQANTDTAGIPIVVVTAKSVTTEDRSELNNAAGKVIQFVDKAGFDSERFVAEVRRSLPLSEIRKNIGQNTNR
jgi:CheY-like chemotaxis protein